jgi:hypothetical protein
VSNECTLEKEKCRIQFSSSRRIKQVKMHKHICHTTLKLQRNNSVVCKYFIAPRIAAWFTEVVMRYLLYNYMVSPSRASTSNRLFELVYSKFCGMSCFTYCVTCSCSGLHYAMYHSYRWRVSHGKIVAVHACIQLCYPDIQFHDIHNPNN